MERYPVSERRACMVLGQSRTSQRYSPIIVEEAGPLAAAIIRLAGQYGRYGYRRVTALLRAEGWHVNHKRVERIWRREGLVGKRRFASAVCLLFYSHQGQAERSPERRNRKLPDW